MPALYFVLGCLVLLVCFHAAEQIRKQHAQQGRKSYRERIAERYVRDQL